MVLVSRHGTTIPMAFRDGQGSRTFASGELLATLVQQLVVGSIGSFAQGVPHAQERLMFKNGSNQFSDVNSLAHREPREVVNSCDQRNMWHGITAANNLAISSCCKAAADQELLIPVALMPPRKGDQLVTSRGNVDVQSGVEDWNGAFVHKSPYGH
eukprot:1968463-Amphidinium_carterae.1